jgi:GT2 family glycosyltransferase/ADP-heptose:LPS heptosyltransferase
MPAPRVRILLLNWNNATDTIECLESVFALDYDRFDVVLCDNGSTDGSVERIAAWAAARGTPVPLRILEIGANLGFAGGNNVGLRAILAEGGAEYVWLLNNDTVVAPGTLRALVERARETPSVGAVGGTMLEYHAPHRVQGVAGGRLSLWHGMMSHIGYGRPASAPRRQPRRLDFVSGCCLLMPVSVLEEVGLLDERFFMYGEDYDWSVRMRHHGKVLVYAPSAEVWHKGGGTSVYGSPVHDYGNVIAPLLLIAKHHPWRLPVAVAYSLYRCLLPKIVRLEWRRLVIVLTVYRDLLLRRSRPTRGGRPPARVAAPRATIGAPTPPPPDAASAAVRQASPLRGPYLVRNPLLYAALTIADRVVAAARPSRVTAPLGSPKRILLALGGHLGDAVMLTAVLRHVRAVAPRVEIGVALPSWSHQVIEHDPRLAWIHTVDHWKGNRSDASPLAKWRRYRATRSAAIADIRAVGYDMAIDLRAHFPNMAGLLRRAGVPVRAGFTSGGFGHLYTHPLAWRQDHTHIVTRQVELVDMLLGASAHARPPQYDLAPPRAAVEAEVSSLLKRAGLAAGDYVVVHMGSGAAERTWPTAEWRTVARTLAADGHRLVFTGQGPRESAAVRAAVAGVAGAVDLSDRLSWLAFVELIRRARLVLTVETAAAHVAAATGTPSVLVWLDPTSARYWRPLGTDVALVVPREAGATGQACCSACADMVCVRELSASAVVAAAARAASAGERSSSPSRVAAGR